MFIKNLVYSHGVWYYIPVIDLKLVVFMQKLPHGMKYTLGVIFSKYP